MEELIDLIATDQSPNQVSDTIKTLLYTKASEKINYVKPFVASSLFGEDQQENSTDDEE